MSLFRPDVEHLKRIAAEEPEVVSVPNRGVTSQVRLQPIMQILRVLTKKLAELHVQILRVLTKKRTLLS